MKVVVDGTVVSDGADRGIDLRGTAISTETLLGVIRGDRATSSRLTLDCPSATAPHEVVGHVDGCLQPSLRAWLAAAARSNGHTAPQRTAYERVQSELDDLTVPDVDVAAARRRVAEAGAEETRLREELATLRGRLQARREMDSPTEAVADSLAATAARLSEVETERLAAEQTLEQRESAAREARAVRDRRLELEDRRDNLRRQMRASLAADVAPRFAETVEALASTNWLQLPAGSGAPAVTTGDGLCRYEGPDVVAQLAVVRIAALDAPVVVSADVVSEDTDATTVAETLDTPTLVL